MAAGRLGRTVRRLREAAGLTQARLARKARLTDAYISMLERGVKRSPSIPALARLAKALGVPVGELLE